MTEAEQVRFVVERQDVGKRLDQILAARVAGLSRRRARVLLDIGGVFVDGARTKVAGRLLRAGQTVVAHLGGALERASKETGREARAKDLAKLPPFRLLHQDDAIVVVDKPAGLLTAPTPEGDSTNLARAVSRAVSGDVFVVHRLDLDTSGVLVFARTAAANRALSELFRVHDVERAYLAVLAGAVEGDEHRLDAPVGGRPALTQLRVLERLSDLSLVRCELHTGRTHQIRIHTQGLGHPVMGDRRYGDVAREGRPPPRMALHATTLGFAHPVSGERVRFEAPLPEDLASWIAQLRGA